jgi:hypothetical protein
MLSACLSAIYNCNFLTQLGLETRLTLLSKLSDLVNKNSAILAILGVLVDLERAGSLFD